MNNSIYKSRKRKNFIGLFLSNAAMVIGIGALIWILIVLFSKGFASLISLDIFIKSTPAAGSAGGGLANAILGSLMIVSLTTIVSTPIGILAGIYLSEYGSTPPIYWSTIQSCSMFLKIIIFYLNSFFMINI